MNKKKKVGKVNIHVQRSYEIHTPKSVEVARSLEVDKILRIKESEEKY